MAEAVFGRAPAIHAKIQNGELVVEQSERRHVTCGARTVIDQN